MDKLPNQVGELVEFIWYAPFFNQLFLAVLLWVALTLALGRIIEDFWEVKLSAQRRRLTALVTVVLLVIVYGLAVWQKDRTINNTRNGIAEYMVKAGLRDISFDQIRQTINSDYSNNLLLAVGQDETSPPVFRLSVLRSLSLKLLDKSRLERIQTAEQLLANRLDSSAAVLARNYPDSVVSGKIGLTFREVDEVVFPQYSQLLIVATLRDYPERYFLKPKQTQGQLQLIDNVYVSVRQLSNVKEPLWARKKMLIR